MDVDATVGRFERLFAWLEATALAAQASGAPDDWLEPWIAQIETRLTALDARVRHNRVAFSELVGAGSAIRTVCVDSADRLPSHATRFEALWNAWAHITRAHPTYRHLSARRSAGRPWTLPRLLHAAEHLGIETETPSDVVLDCLLGNHPLPFGPSDSHERRCARNGYSHSPSKAALAALATLHLAEGDMFYDLGSGLGSPTVLATLGSRAQCRGIEIHAAYVDRARATADALGLRDDLFVAADVLEHDWSDGNRFYLFNPFSSSVLCRVSDRLRLLSRRREVHVACIHTHLGEGFAATLRRGIVTHYQPTGR